MHGSCLWAGFLLILDFRQGSEIVRKGVEELFSPLGWEEPEHALTASKELQVKSSGRLPVGAGPVRGTWKNDGLIKINICKHSWRAAFIAFFASGACRDALARDNGSGRGGTEGPVPEKDRSL